MNWKDEEMSPAEAKEKALGILRLWLDIKKSEVTRLILSLGKKRARIQRIASANIKNRGIRRFLKFLDALLSIFANWTASKIRKAQKRRSNLTEAILELKSDKPDKAIEMLADHTSYAMTTSDDIGVDSSNGIARFFVSVIHGLHGLNKGSAN